MYPYFRPLYFPQLFQVHGEATLDGPDPIKNLEFLYNGEPVPKNFYVLDWNKSLDIASKRYGDRIPIFPNAPEWLDDVDKAVYVLSSNYVDGVRKAAKLAVSAWNEEWYFDTIVRDQGLKPAIEYVYYAFYLLADCLYDLETKYFARHPLRSILPQILAFEFWWFQTGSGNILEHSKTPSVADVERSMQAGASSINEIQLEWSKYAEDRVMALDVSLEERRTISADKVFGTPE
ncbi:hypothetical protein LCGC14_0146030 [marine sediment metagenome]|uniref:Uncharacterized protein n=1 Tax=marine sediment metagenome TaxID=412755 RepID=A0A0F9VFC7_9ZZZZ